MLASLLICPTLVLYVIVLGHANDLFLLSLAPFVSSCCFVVDFCRPPHSMAFFLGGFPWSESNLKNPTVFVVVVLCFCAFFFQRARALRSNFLPFVRGLSPSLWFRLATLLLVLGHFNASSRTPFPFSLPCRALMFLLLALRIACVSYWVDIIPVAQPELLLPAYCSACSILHSFARGSAPFSTTATSTHGAPYSVPALLSASGSPVVFLFLFFCVFIPPSRQQHLGAGPKDRFVPKAQVAHTSILVSLSTIATQPGCFTPFPCPAPSVYPPPGLLLPCGSAHWDRSLSVVQLSLPRPSGTPCPPPPHSLARFLPSGRYLTLRWGRPQLVPFVLRPALLFCLSPLSPLFVLRFCFAVLLFPPPPCQRPPP